MGAVDEATRGPIEEVTHFRHDMTDEAAEAERTFTMHRVLGELEPILAKPVYEGDVQTALIHHMGRVAFGYSAFPSDRVSNYIRFAEAIEEAIEANTDEGRPTPVLFVSQIRPRDGSHRNTETALVMVDPETASFRSSVVHEQDVKERGYADKIAVTRRSIALVGETATIHADISGYGHDQVLRIHDGDDDQVQQSELVLSQQSIIDGKNGYKPIPIEHDDFGQDINRMGTGPTYVVGWERIGKALSERVYNIAHRSFGIDERQEVFPYILKLRGFLERTGQLEVLLAHNAPLRKTFKHAVGLQESVAALAPTWDPED